MTVAVIALNIPQRQVVRLVQPNRQVEESLPLHLPPTVHKNRFRLGSALEACRIIGSAANARYRVHENWLKFVQPNRQVEESLPLHLPDIEGTKTGLDLS
jgi:hypothetical protein